MSGNKKSFWSTIPGILTGIAALITAATGLYVALSHDEAKRTHITPSISAPDRQAQALSRTQDNNAAEQQKFKVTKKREGSQDLDRKMTPEERGFDPSEQPIHELTGSPSSVTCTQILYYWGEYAISLLFKKGDYRPEQVEIYKGLLGRKIGWNAEVIDISLVLPEIFMMKIKCSDDEYDVSDQEIATLWPYKDKDWLHKFRKGDKVYLRGRIQERGTPTGKVYIVGEAIELVPF